MSVEIEKEIEDKVRVLFKTSKRNMGDILGIRFIKISRDEMRASMPVDENTIQPFGILHGGASVALAETLASIGAWLNVKDDNKKAVGLEINANHLRPVPKGKTVTGTASPIHIGSKTQVWEIRIVNEQEQLVSVSRCTLAVV